MSNPDRIYLEPDTGDPDNRTWSEDALWPLPGSGDDREGVEYIRADLATLPNEPPPEWVEAMCEGMRWQRTPDARYIMTVIYRALRAKIEEGR